MGTINKLTERTELLLKVKFSTNFLNSQQNICIQYFQNKSELPQTTNIKQINRSTMAHLKY